MNHWIVKVTNLRFLENEKGNPETNQNKISEQGGALSKDFIGFSNFCNLDQLVDLTSKNPNTQLMRLPVENIENTERMTADPNEISRDLTVIPEWGSENPKNLEVPVAVTREE